MHVHPLFSRLRLIPYLVCLAFVVPGLPVIGQTSANGNPAKPAAAPLNSTLAWNRLSARQQAALQPLAPIWNEINASRKRKWIALSADFEKLSPAERAKLHGRMREWAALSNADRNQARLNFAETRGLSSEQKKAHWEAYQALTPEQKQQLASQASSQTAIGAAPAVTHRSTGKLAAVPVTRSDAGSAASPSPSLPAAHSEAGAKADGTPSP